MVKVCVLPQSTSFSHKTKVLSRDYNNSSVPLSGRWSWLSYMRTRGDPREGERNVHWPLSMCSSFHTSLWKLQLLFSMLFIWHQMRAFQKQNISFAYLIWHRPHCALMAGVLACQSRPASVSSTSPLFFDIFIRVVHSSGAKSKPIK